MKEAGVAALGRFVLAGKEKLCLIRPMGDALALETLFVHEDVKDHAEIDEAVGDRRGARRPSSSSRSRSSPRSRRRSSRRSCSSEYRESLRELLEAKLAGQEFELPDAGGARAGRRPDGGAQGVGRRGVQEAEPADDKKKAAPRKRAAASIRRS